MIALVLAVAGPGSAFPIDVAARTTPSDTGVSLAVSTTSGPLPLGVEFNASVASGQLEAINWSFGDGTGLNATSAAALTPVHVYTRAGTFVASIRVEEDHAYASAAVAIRVYSGELRVAVAATPVSGSAPLTVDFVATPSGGSETFESFRWSFGDGQEGTGASIAYTFGHAGSFEVRVNVTDTANDSGTGVVWINVTGPSAGGPSGPWSGAWGYAVVGGLVISAIGILVLVDRRLRWSGGTSAPIDRTAVEERSFPSPGPPSPTAPGSDPYGIAASGIGTSREASPPATAPNGPPATPDRRVSSRLILHLQHAGALGIEDLGTADHTQHGIAEALGVGQNVVSKLLTRLRAAGVVESNKRHVSGRPTRLNVYWLTPHGERIARELRARNALPAFRGRAPDPAGPVDRFQAPKDP